MIRFAIRALLILVCLPILLGSSKACKYSVRDVGFVDLGATPYRLLIWYGEGTAPDELERMKDVAAAELRDSNVQAEWIDLRDDADPKQYRFRPTVGEQPDAQAPPSASLVAPDGRRRSVKWDHEQDSLKSFRQAVRDLVHSPARERIFTRLMSAHSVLLVVEGTDAQQNAAAAELAAGAVKRIAETLPSLPKTIENPPAVVTLSSEEARQEAVTLWSLDLEAGAGKGPPESSETHESPTQIVVLFGRGRVMGSPLTMPGLTLLDILQWQALVGQDCECDLDRSVMQGQMMPHVWTAERESAVVEHLGFDPGSPLVQSEIARILNRGPNSQPRNLRIGLPQRDNPLKAYREIEIAIPTEEIGEAATESGTATETEATTQDDATSREGADSEKVGANIVSGESGVSDEAKASNSSQSSAGPSGRSRENAVAEEPSPGDQTNPSTRAGASIKNSDDLEEKSGQRSPDSHTTVPPAVTIGVSVAALFVLAFALGGWFLWRSSQGT